MSDFPHNPAEARAYLEDQLSRASKIVLVEDTAPTSDITRLTNAARAIDRLLVYCQLHDERTDRFRQELKEWKQHARDTDAREESLVKRVDAFRIALIELARALPDEDVNPL